MKNITSLKEKENINTIKNDKIGKTTMGTKTWTKVKKRALKIWHKNYVYFRTQFKELDI